MLPRIDAILFGPARPRAWCLALLLALGTAQGAEVPLRAPTALPARRSDLPAAFTKAAPASLSDLQTIQRRVESLVRRLSPAVVAVEIGESSGSGVVISADGLVLTAGHVCAQAKRRVVFTFPDGKTAHGRILGADVESDTGLMQITDRGSWPHAPMGDLREAQAGDWVLAMGHPGGFDVRRSLVVRLGRIIRLMPDGLQTDCTISLGDSGGPLFDMHGRVIGVHSAINPSLAGNFHVSISAFDSTWGELVKAVARRQAHPVLAYFGASGVDAADGCRLDKVEADSPASQAGLRVGDVVLQVDGRDVKAAAVFRRWVEESEPGETLKLQVRRGEKLLSLAVKVGASPQPESKQ